MYVDGAESIQTPDLGRRVMRTIWTWLKRGVVGVYAAIAGLFGGGGQVIADRKEMYGDDPANDPYSIEYDPSRKEP